MRKTATKLRNDGTPQQEPVPSRASSRRPVKSRPLLDEVEATGDLEFIAWFKANDRGKWATISDAKLDFRLEFRRWPK